MIRHHIHSYGQHKLMAIKLVRELTCSGLAEAKDLVDRGGSFFVLADGPTRARVAAQARQFGIEFDPPLEPARADESLAASASGYSVRVVASGSKHLDNALARILVHELTGLSLRAAKGIVERGEPVRCDMSRDEAEVLVRRFADLGVKAELIHDFEDEDDYDF